ncbi:MAG: hypothetical protein K9N51_07930 [Candidatus Pacebacteria bacterium]|nr:hypothetical protein [Candidatus Paceibacterota bacterium]
MRKTIHFIYAKGKGIRTPWAITNELQCRLSVEYDVVVHDWAEKKVIVPSPGNILLGHPHPEPDTVFRRSFWQKGWAKRIVMIPFRHEPYINEVAWWDPLVRHADHFLAICGRYWVDTMGTTWVSHWKRNLIQLDLAVDRVHFPRIKEDFSPKGERKFLCISWPAAYKGFDYFLDLVRANPGLSFAWAGQYPERVDCPELTKLGYMDFSLEPSKAILAQYDFMLTCGRSDPNPTTILEAASWGMVSICTPQSGYYDEDWLVNIPLDNVQKASAILHDLNECDPAKLALLRRNADHALDSHYTWDRFAADVASCIEAPLPQSFTRVQWLIALRNSFVLSCIRAKTYLLANSVCLHRLRTVWWSLHDSKRT